MGNKCVTGPPKGASDEHPRGLALLRNPALNRDQAFSSSDRTVLGLHGLLPPAQTDIENQRSRELARVQAKSSNIDKYDCLMELYDRNYELFFRLLSTHLEELLPIVYTPTVGQACEENSFRFTRPRGLYIPLSQAGNVCELVANWPEKQVQIIVFTDGERILGLGDQGINGMCIPVGKLQVYSVAAGIDPRKCLPVCLDVGTDSDRLLHDPFYLGTKSTRERGPAYDSLVEEFMYAAAERWGDTTVMQFEDFANKNAFRLLRKTRDRFTTFNDDVQGTAAVVLAGVLASVRKSRNTPGAPSALHEHRFLFLGAGEAGVGIAHLLARAIFEESSRTISMDEARRQIWLLDSHGLVFEGRKATVDEHKQPFAHELSLRSSQENPAAMEGTPKSTILDETARADGGIDLVTAIKLLEPTALIGSCAVEGAFTQESLQALVETCPTPLVFPLSNPTSKSECTAEQAYNWTGGKCVFASGSPFASFRTKTDKGTTQVVRPSQANNALVFPGIGLGLIACKARSVPDELLLAAAAALADSVSDSDLSEGALYPPLSMIRMVSCNVAERVAARAYDVGVATLKPKPSNMHSHVRSFMHVPSYNNERAAAQT